MTATADDSVVLLRVRDVARALGLHPRTVWRLSACGELPKPISVGGSTRWVRAEILDWIASKAQAAERERQKLAKTT